MSQSKRTPAKSGKSKAKKRQKNSLRTYHDKEFWLFIMVIFIENAYPKKEFFTAQEICDYTNKSGYNLLGFTVKIISDILKRGFRVGMFTRRNDNSYCIGKIRQRIEQNNKSRRKLGFEC